MRGERTRAAALRDDMIGSQFGQYRIEAKLGEGGMGAVYRAVDTELDRTVAIKTMLSTADPTGLDRFMREARAASRLQHPTIVTIHHFGVEGDTRYIVMEFVEGPTLKQMIDGRPMELRSLADIGVQVCEGLATAHANGVIHRDIKAENIIITTRGQAKILDFGIAKLQETGADDLRTQLQTGTGVVVGTLTNMSPEQALGKQIDARTDIFSLGVVLYEMATGRGPFVAATAQATMARVLSHEPEPIVLSNPGVPAELAQAIHSCLEKDSAVRPAAEEALLLLKSARETVNPLVRGTTRASAGRPALPRPAVRVPRREHSPAPPP